MGRPRVVSYCEVSFLHVVFAASKRVVSLKLEALAANFIALWLRQSRHAPLCVLLMLTAALCGCSASNVIGLYAADYRDTTANAGDAQLLLNILRAKDNLPIHFYDLSNIHGSVQWTAGVGASDPFGVHSALDANLLTPSFSAQNNPSFDVGTSDTQDFTKGMLAQLDARVVKALFDEGVDPRIMLMLFFSEYREPSGKVLLNTMACDPSTDGKRPDLGCYNQVYAYLDEINNVLELARVRSGIGPRFKAKVRANVFNALTPVGGYLAGAWNLGSLDQLRQLDDTKFKLVNQRLYSVSLPRLAVCYERAGTLVPLFADLYPAAACTDAQVIMSDSPATRRPLLPLRSAYDIIQYLGQVLRFQQEYPKPNECLTLDQHKRGCDTGEVLFQVNAPVGRPVIGTRYGDSWFALSDRDCNKKQQEACDYSVQVLAVLELLLNENKKAQDLVATPRVLVVQ
jgi:hypothetical protein